MTALSDRRAHGPTTQAGAILAMLVSQALFTSSDVFAKLAAQAGLPATQIMALRGLVAVALVAFLAWRMGALNRFPAALQPLVMLRAGMESAIAILFLIALPNMTLADITVILQAAPLILTGLSAWLLSESVGWRRWTATAVGFAGVVIVARPGGDGLNLFALMALACAFLIAGRDIVTRRLDPAIPTLAITLTTTSAVCATGFLGAPAQAWVPMTPWAWACLAGSAVFVSAGNYFVVQAFRSGEVSVVAPFRYAVVVWAMLAGFLVWREVPDAVAFLGAGLIVGSGLYTFHRQRVRMKEMRVAN